MTVPLQHGERTKRTTRPYSNHTAITQHLSYYMSNAIVQRLSRRVKQAILLLADVLFLPLGVWGGFAVVEQAWMPPKLLDVWWCLPLSIAVSMPFFIRSGMYRAVLRKAGDAFFVTIVRTVAISVLCTMFAVKLLSSVPIHWMVWVSNGLLLLLFVGGVRWFARYFLVKSFIVRHEDRIPVAIYGAGNSGYQLLGVLEQSIELKPVVFIDDKAELHGTEIRGLKVHAPADLDGLIERLNIRRLLLSMPSTPRHRRQQIIRFLEPKPLHIQDIPSLVELASGCKQVDEIREIAEEDLLGRDPIPPNQALLEACISGKSVLVTGAGGSIGSELCRQICKLRPHRLVLVERSEYSLYAVTMELERLKSTHDQDELEIVPILGSVRHRNRMQVVLEVHQVQTIYHAAAYKHVAIVERNPIEGIQNNIFGTFQMAQAAITAKVETFILISSDKAVRPTNVMGATKRCSELILQALAATEQGICFSMVRFGNVLDSSGSVIPRFRRQIRRGGPITVTDPEVTRFFMTIPEATQLVIQASAMARCGDVFVLDMGEPVRILDLARRMIQLSGLTVKDEQNPNGDVSIIITGLQPGEKLYEELLIGGNASTTEHPMIMRIQEDSLSLQEVVSMLDRLEVASKTFDFMAIRDILVEVVEGYQPLDDIKDWGWRHPLPDTVGGLARRGSTGTSAYGTQAAVSNCHSR